MDSGVGWSGRRGRLTGGKLGWKWDWGLGWETRLPSSPLSHFLGEGSPTKIDYRKKGTLILTSKTGGPSWVLVGKSARRMER